MAKTWNWDIECKICGRDDFICPRSRYLHERACKGDKHCTVEGCTKPLKNLKRGLCNYHERLFFERKSRAARRAAAARIEKLVNEIGLPGRDDI